MKVDIIEAMEDGTSRRIATFLWREGQLSCDNPVLWKHMMNSGGAVITGKGKRYFPQDGIDYLRNLKFQFAGPFLFAQDVEESSDPDTEPAAALSPAALSASFTSLSISRPDIPLDPGPRGQIPAAGARRTGGSGSSVKTVELKREAPRPEGSSSEAAGSVGRELQEQIWGTVFRLSSTVRGLSFVAAKEECDRLLHTLTVLVKTDASEMKRSFEARDEYVELKVPSPTRGSYARVWERVSRYWHNFLSVLAGGDLQGSLWPLFLMREGLGSLTEHRKEWIQGHTFYITGLQPGAGVQPADLSRTWETCGLPTLTRLGASARLLQDIYNTAGEPLHRGLILFQQANFGQAEVELRQALGIDPSLTEARLVLGDICRRMDRVPEALAEFQHASEHETLGMKLIRGGSARSSSYFQEARARMGIGRTLLGVGRTREAIEPLEAALLSLDALVRGTSPDADGDAQRLSLREDRVAIHRLLEPIYRAIGAVDTADQHRKLADTP